MPARSSGGGSTAQLNYVIAARDAQFQRVADRVTKRLERLERQGRQSTRQVTRLSDAIRKFPGFGLLGSAAAAISVHRLNQRLTESISRLDTLGKRARNIGIGVEQLQLWTQAAKEAGVQTDGFQRGLLRFNRVFAEASEGTTEYIDIFDRLGVRIRTGTGELRPLQDVLQESIARFGDLSIAAQQLTAEELFGRGGREMRAFLADFQTQVAGVATGFQGATAGSVALAEAFQNLRDRAGSNLTAALDEFFVRLDDGLGLTRRLTESMNGLAEAVRGVNELLADPRGSLDRFREEYRLGLHTRTPDDPDRQRLAAHRAAREAVGQEPAGPLRVEITGGQRIRDRFHPGNLPQHLRHRPERPPSRRGRDTEEPPDIDRLAFRLGEAMRRREARSAREREMRLERIAGINKRIEDARYAAAAQFIDLQRRQTEERLRGLERVRAAERKRFEEAQERLAGVISNFIKGTGDIGSAIQGFVLDITNTIIGNFSNRLAGQLLSGIGGGFLTNLFGFQRGGDVQRGRAILVGEGGPEVFVPRTAGHIIPNQIASAPAPAPAVNLTFNISSTDGPGVRSAIREAQPQLTAAALRAVATQQSRPGSVLGLQNRRG